MEKTEKDTPTQQSSTIIAPPKYDFTIDEEEDNSLKERLTSFCQYHPYLCAPFIISFFLFPVISFSVFLSRPQEPIVVLLNLSGVYFFLFSLISFILSFTSVKLLLAASSGKLDKIDEELRKGVNINVTSLGYSSSAIFQAVKSGRLRTVKFLIERGADIHSFDAHGLSTLHHSSSAKMTEYLLFLGVKVDETRHMSRMTPLHLAIIWHRFDIAKLLVERGANVHLEDASGYSALPYALRCSSVFSNKSNDLIEAILRAGADTRQGFTSCCIRYESCESYAKIWNSSTINTLISKINPYTPSNI